MDHITKILEKLNLGRSDQQVTLADIMPLSVAEVRNKAGRRLSREEAQLLQRAAVKEKQNNILFAARALTRANPLLRKEMGVARHHGATPYGYDDIIMPRADKFAAPGAVSSMFSPAGYLTELYREARGLHQKGSANNLDQRRPDLAKLVLSQENLDQEVSTLALANDQLESALMAKAGQTEKTKYYETLATSRHSGVTPYNAPFERVREALIQQDFSLPDSILSKGAESTAQLALAAGISPELYKILTEKTDGLSEAETEALLKKNFPGVNTNSLMNLDALANYYELPRDEIQTLQEIYSSEIPYGSSLKDIHNLYGKNKTQVIKAKDTDGDVFYTLTHTGLKIESTDWINFEYIDLIPLNNNQFCINFSISHLSGNTHSLYIGIPSSSNYPTDLYSDSKVEMEKGKHYSIPVTINAEIIPEITISVCTRTSYKWYGHSTFAVTKTTVPLPLPALNKTLRLAKATGLTPLETQRALTRLRFSKDDTDTTVLHRFCEALHYRNRYCIDTETALMLCKADISTASYDGQLSQFDRLFNNPPLNGVTYTLGGGDIPMKPDSKDPRREVLKRAFRVDNTGLWQIFNINDQSDLDKLAINNIIELSPIYLARLLADVNNLTVAQLYALLQVSPYRSSRIYFMADPERRELINFLYQTTQWLNAQNISVEQLVMLLTTDAPAAPTQEMNALLDALRNGGIDSTDTDILRTTMAPVIAAAMQMESPEQGEALLHWLDNNHPDNVPVTNAIWPLISTEKPSADQQKKIAAYCQALAQRVLAIRTFTLSGIELQVLSQDAPANTIAALRGISDFHNLINRCGEQAGTVLDALQSGTLTVAILAKALNLSEHVITQALTQAGQSTSLTSWKQLATLPVRLDLADNLNITPKEITNLLAVSESTTPSYADLSTLSALLQAGLNEQQTQQLQDLSESRRSEALSGEYRSLIMGKPLANRDDIWRNLLIDGKVSAAITTTQLADAIAGIQLYINRTIAGDEPGADSAVLERQFFKDWDIYNKRYSTWAGVSQLAYYPENFIDPTLRIGQTGMMNTMLEQLSQSELNSDTLENGFRQYLTAFEQVANLNVVSGYHDAVNIDDGNTWFIGTSQTTPKKYYWRKADHSKCKNGHFAANAWSDWKEITCSVSPYQDMIRPVIYRSRLYLLWIEEQVRKEDDGKKNTSSFTLKLTHIKYDGSWASPFSYDVTKEFNNQFPEKQDKALYCATNTVRDTITVICYKKEDEGTLPVNAFGLLIRPDMTKARLLNSKDLLTAVKSQLDTLDVTRINTKESDYTVSTITPEDQEGYFGLETNIFLEKIDSYKEGDKQFLTVQPTLEAKIDITAMPQMLRRPFAKDYLNFGYDLYQYESVTLAPGENKLPLGDYNFYILLNQSTQNYFLYLSIPFGKSAPDYAKDIGVTITPPDGIPSTEKLNWEGSDTQNHYYSLPTLGKLAPNIKYYQIANMHSSLGQAIGKLNVSKLQRVLSAPSRLNAGIKFYKNSNVLLELSEAGNNTYTKQSTAEGTLLFTYQFSARKLDVTEHIVSSQLDLSILASLENLDNAPVHGSRNYKLYVELVKNDAAVSTRAIALHITEDGAQYMEWDAYRTRLNTLFARQLIERANSGIDAVLSPETQSLRESKPGQGTYVTLTLKPYDPAIHGSDRKFTLYYADIFISDDQYPIYSSTLSTDRNTEVTLFIPLLHDATGIKSNFYLQAKYQKTTTTSIRLHRTTADNENPHGWTLDKSFNNGAFPGLESVSGLAQPDEPMDFSGANALYFWELFYYTPMMVSMRLLQEQNFTDANRWLSYIWQPALSGTGDWRVRPLKEDTSWNADPMDSVDPDAVAQNDPMHYKVSTLMKLIDLLIARGDSAYRMLERDTLSEAKMWYMQALGLLGDKPVTIIGSGWSNPALSDAANNTQVKQYHDDISRIRSGGMLPETRTANTLTGLFRPQQNEKLLGYWQTLEMRLFNLRNDLSIDGQSLSLPIFAAPADPAALLSAAAAASGGGKALPSADIPAMRFPQALESARSLTGQLMQFGSTLQGLIERQDAEAMSELLQNQAGELMLSSLRMQAQTLAELDAEKKVLEQSRAGAQSRFDSYCNLYDENVSAAEKRTMDLYLSSSVLSTSIEALNMASAAADMAPNIFGVAVGGSRWGGIPKAIGSGIALAASATKITADNISQSEAWRRRRQEWEIQKNSAESDVKQIDAQLDALSVRRTATEMQREHLEIQQAQTQAQLEFLQRKFSNKALYSWLRGRLAAIYYRFYDLTAARSMMAEAAFAWQTGETTRYIKPGAWQSSNAGLMAGESLLLNLTEMEQAWLKWDCRVLEVTRTVSLDKVYKGYKSPVILADAIAGLLKGSGSGSTPAATGLSMTKDGQLHAAFNLSALNIMKNYPSSLGETRRIKQISVTLPALAGPYQDVRAVLSYGGGEKLAKGCKAIAVSHGMNDSGQFQLDFNDGRWLPFEGIPVNDNNSLTLSFPEATEDEQKALLLSLSDIIVHIRYTIR